MNNIGIVVQGPLVSVGKTGKDMMRPRLVPQEDIVTFDCVPTILEVAALAKDHGLGPFRVVVRETDPQDSIARLVAALGEESIVCMPAPVLDDKPQYMSNNARNQFTSTLEGVRAVRKAGATRVIKIRSDQFVRIDLLARDLNRFISPEDKKILIPWMDTKHPISVMDFYFAANIQPFEEFLEFLLQNAKLHYNVHIELLKALATYNLGPTMLPGRFIFAKTWNKRILKTYHAALIPASRDIYQTTIWRGKHLADPQGQFVHSDDAWIESMKAVLKNRPILPIAIAQKIARKVGIAKA